MPLAEAARDAGLRAGFHLVSDDRMSRDAHLAAEHAPLPDFGGTGHADLGGHDGVCSHFHIVGNLDEVVYLYAFAHDGGTHGRTVNAGVRPDFHVVFDGDNADLRDFLISVFCGSKPEAVSPDDAS